MNPEQVFIGRAKKYNQFSQGENKEGQSCRSCIRKHFSFPYTCNDGWATGDPKWVDRGASCINWSDNPQCQVD